MTSITGFGNIAASLSKLRDTLTAAETDTNTPVTLTEAQFEAAAKTDPNLTSGGTALAAFQKLDADHNGQLDTDELTAGINLNTQVQSVLLQSQDLSSGSAFLALLGGSGSSSSSSSLFNSGADDFSGLTSSLLGGGSDSTSLASLLSGGNTNTSTLAGLFGSGDTSSTDTYTALLQQLIASYTPTAAPATGTDTPATTTPVDTNA